jgi:predicted GNAT superfamily acetyltransferase
MLIRDIQSKDYPAVLAINEFSVAVLSPLNQAQLERLIEQASIAVVAELDDNIAAFLLVVGPSTDYSSVNYQWFNQQYSDFLYIDRIVVHHNYRGKQLGQRLYEYVQKQAKAKSTARLCAEIDIQPPNLPSLKFHEKWGFCEVYKLHHESVAGTEKVVSLQTKPL